jgi:hypothetical protein
MTNGTTNYSSEEALAQEASRDHHQDTNKKQEKSTKWKYPA